MTTTIPSNVPSKKRIKAPQWPEPTDPRPTLSQLEDWMLDGDCEATDGCRVEPDGVCPHGHPSWLIRLGLC